MGKSPAKKDEGSKAGIRILLVDDMPEAREGIKKLLQFEQEFKVVGGASNGREGVAQAKELKPDIVIMDINMPDMDGLEAAALITKALPMVGVIMMSVQDDTDYLQRAMMAGARFFLTKPPDMDKLYNTIRMVYQQYAPLREQFERIAQGVVIPAAAEEPTGEGGRAGHVIVVYSPTGGAGCTTVATSLASGLMREGIRSLLIDADLQFGDVGAFLDLRPQATLVDVVEAIDELDIDYFENLVTTHNSGLKVLLGPPRPAMGVSIRDEKPDVLPILLEQIASYYDFVVLDVGKSIDAVTAGVLERASKIVLLVNPSLPSIKNTRLVIDWFDSVGFAADKVSIVLNKAVDPRQVKGVPPPERIQQFLKRQLEGTIPLVDERIILNAVNKGIPVIASDRDTTKSPIKELTALSNHVYTALMGEEKIVEDQEVKPARGGWFGRK
ncbi:MAG: response regulator [Anaerolineae bacterium]|jgi:pilus assembly protein CpaE|nr:response regulator [Anaerolineae bacterium]